jgi:hypothetical protein
MGRPAPPDGAAMPARDLVCAAPTRQEERARRQRALPRASLRALLSGLGVHVTLSRPVVGLGTMPSRRVVSGNVSTVPSGVRVDVLVRHLGAGADRYRELCECTKLECPPPWPPPCPPPLATAESERVAMATAKMIRFMLFSLWRRRVRRSVEGSYTCQFAKYYPMFTTRGSQRSLLRGFNILQQTLAEDVPGCRRAHTRTCACADQAPARGDSARIADR